ncbi:MAG: tetratricopeptide repeat protein [Ruminococcaceae bacterium]|nr:tetratricopeptide repeat protein [Oscillospiraceae bacterium]
MNFGENIRRLRLAKRFTQEYVANELSVSAQSVSRWETSATFPDILLLPAIAKLYCVTVDDLFREDSVSYENYAHRLLSVYENTRSQEDFLAADREFAKLIESDNFSMKDCCMYGMLYQYGMEDCINKAFELFDKGLSLDENDDPDTHHWIERQKILLNAQIGCHTKNISKYSEYNKMYPDDPYGYINLIQSYHLSRDYDKALKIFLKAETKFDNPKVLYIYGGSIYKDMGEYFKAIECYERAFEIDSSYTHALHKMAECYDALGDFENAYKIYRRIEQWYKERGYSVETDSMRAFADQYARNKIH